MAVSEPQRWALGVEYDGSGFVGWQRQKDGPSVQAAVEQALGFVAGHPVDLHCAGRTDAGVHATGQVIHFDTTALRDERNWLLGANARLPEAVALLWARPVSRDFHARFSAQGRRYRYVIANQAVRPALQARGVAWWRYPLDAGRMHEAAQALLGTHDFSSLRAAACQARSAIKTVHSIRVHRQGRYVVLDVHANAFLHHMVRNIAGVLLPIGQGRRDAGWVHEIMNARDRRASGITAPAGGLYLVGVDYDPVHRLPGAGQAPTWPVFPQAFGDGSSRQGPG
ncbi:tRNA pseudouridine(38-40) synthase TruA [Thioalkalivibrio paradoxus]|uniref:tRNA pseudouridine synthase A n=1 Tax=Thioalkalivibrio paradoxus ARh 1 TaxID=713585 RepID=W0DNS4_9GAMM|nr:tRNA pseudouridine(38-40) synthase TruA [Thioalkalivibrio paradoxus]AHE98648.1 tRNA pseudouridine synthase A [Thioalkalivibrio paradoxus ARh 1]